jgi:hypothetical protein
MFFIYIIYSNQFGENVYKVGYTKDPNRRIKDSCYTTCFYEPCIYKNIWKCDTTYINEESIEKELHKELQRNKNTHLSNKINKCSEMYKMDYDILEKSINNFLNEHKSVKIINNKYEINDYDFIYNNGTYVGFHKTLKKKKKCMCCNRSIKYLWAICYKNTYYYLGKACYQKKYDEYNIPKRVDKIKAHVSEFELNISYEDYTDIAMYMWDDEINDISIRHETLLKFAQRKWQLDCTCSNLYKLHKLCNQLRYKFEVELHGDMKIVKFIKYLKVFKTFKIDNFKVSYLKVNMMLDEITEYFKDTRKLARDLYEIKHEKIYKYDRAILSGSAGTGKTSGIFGFIDTDTSTYTPSRLSKYYQNAHPKILILTFTGKALSEIKKSHKKIIEIYESSEFNAKYKESFKYLSWLNNNITFKTIDSYLLSMSYIGEKIPKLECYDFLIIDEFSMVTIEHMYKILISQKFKRVLVVGDENQLPPINGPSIISYLIDNNRDAIKYFRLTENLRACVESIKNIYKYAETCEKLNIKYIQEHFENKPNIKFINMGELPNLIHNDINGDIQIISYNNSNVDKIYKIINNIPCKKYMCIKNVYLCYEQVKYLIKLLECDQNELYLLDSLEYKFIITYLLSLINKKINDKILTFYNGQELYDNTCLLSIDFIDKLKTLINSTFDKKFEYDQCNVMTIHKSQGSGYRIAIIDVTTDNLCRKALYTAITRAKNQIYFIIPAKINEYEDILANKIIEYCNKIKVYKICKSYINNKMKEIVSVLTKDNMNWALNKVYLHLDDNEKNILSKSLKKYRNNT